jgi:glycosyltransferase involved in cell wall biosynthesis
VTNFFDDARGFSRRIKSAIQTSIKSTARDAPRWAKQARAVAARNAHIADPLRERFEQVLISSAPLMLKVAAYRSLLTLHAASDVQSALDAGEELLPLVADSAGAHRALAGWYVRRHAIVRPSQLLEQADALTRTRHNSRVQQQAQWLEHGLRWNSGAQVAPVDSVSRRVVYLAASTLPYHSAGYGARTQGLVHALISRGWDIHVVARPGYPNDRWDSQHIGLAPSSLQVDGVPYWFMPNQAKLRYARDIEGYHRDAADVLESKCRELKPTLIHAASNYNCGLLAAEVGRRLAIPVVYEVRGFWHVSKAADDSHYEDSDHFHMIAGFEAQAARAANHVFAITSGIAEELTAAGVDRRQISLLPNAAEVDKWQPRPPDEELRQRLGISDSSAVMIGYVGSLNTYEGLDDLISAVATLQRDQNLPAKIFVVIVGDGAAKPTLQQQALALGISDAVHFTGRVAPADVARYYSIMDICALPRKPTRVCELVSPLKPFEAMAMQRAIVASNVAAQADIVKDGVTGRLFAKGDVADLARVLRELIAAPAERKRLGIAASNWVRTERSWDIISAEVDQVYLSLTDSKH